MKRILHSKLASSAGIYTVSNVFNSAIPFLLMPVLTRFLSPTDYGLTATFQVLVGFVAPFVGLSINGAIARTFFSKEAVDLPGYITNCLYLLCGCTLIVGTILWLFAGPVSKIAVFPEGWLWSVIIVAAGQCLALVVLTIWQFQEKSVKYGGFQVALTALNGGLSLWLVVALGFKWEGRVLAQVAVAVFSLAAGGFLLLKGGWLKHGINKKYLYSAVAFGVPLIPHAFGGWLTAAADRLFISNMVGLADTGIYTVGCQVTQVIALIAVSVNTAFAPWLYKRLAENDPKTNLKIVKFTYIYVIGMFAFALVFTFLAPLLLNVFVGKDFRNASQYIFWLALAQATQALYFMTCNYIFYSAKTGYIAIATFVSAFVHILATYLLIRSNGTLGAAQATVISSVVSAGLTWWFAARLHKMPWALHWSKKAGIHI